MAGSTKWMWVSVIAASMFGVGCASESGTNASAQGTDEVASARAPMDEEGRAASARYAVVVAPGEGALETRIYDGLGSQHASYAGLVVPGAAGMWRWEEGIRKVTQADCACVSEQMIEGAEPSDPEACHEEREVMTGRFVNATTGEEWAPEELSMGEDERWWDVTMTPVGAVGSVGLITVCVDSYFCGAAHPGVECEQLAVDFGAASPARVEVGALSERLDAENFEGVKLGANEDVEVEAGDAKLVALIPGWNVEEGRLVAEQQYAFGACYACSDGEWSSYTVSTFVDERPLKIEQSGERPPRGLRDLLSASGWEIRAVSHVPEVAVATPD